MGIFKDNLRGIPEVDGDIGLKYFVGNEKNYIKALYAVLKSGRSKLPLLYSMLTHGEYHGLRVIMRALASLFKNIGATELSEDSFCIEALCLNEAYDLLEDELSSYYEKLSDFLNRLEVALRTSEVVDTTYYVSKKII